MMNFLSLMIIISSTQLFLCSDPNYSAKFSQAQSQEGNVLIYPQRNSDQYLLEKRTIPLLYNSKYQSDPDFQGPFDPWAGRKRSELLKNTQKANKLLNLNRNLNAYQEISNSGKRDFEQGGFNSKPQKRKILSVDEFEDSEDETSQELSDETGNYDCNIGNGLTSCYAERGGAKPTADEMLIPWNSKSLNNFPDQMEIFDTEPDKFEIKKNYSPWGGKRSKVVPFSYSNERGISNYEQEGKITSEFNNRIRNFIFLAGGRNYKGLVAKELKDLNEYIINNFLINSKKSNIRNKRELLKGKKNLNDDVGFYVEEDKLNFKQNNALNSFGSNNKLDWAIDTPNNNINSDQNNYLVEFEGQENQKGQNQNTKQLGEQKIVQNYSSWEEKKIGEFLRDSRSLDDVEIEKEGNQSRNYIQSSPFRNLRNFEPWAGKRNFNIPLIDDVEDNDKCSPSFNCFKKRIIQNERNESKSTLRNLRNFDAWGGKRNYNAWGGKRSYSPWGGKRSYSPWGGKRNYNAWGGKRSYSPWGGKRNYNAWGGKRSYSAWGGKRKYNAWGGKRSYSPWGGKRNYNAWGGKRNNNDEKKSYNPWGGKRSYNAWGGKRSYSPWGGKRANKCENSAGSNSNNGQIKNEDINWLLKSNPNKIKSKGKEITVKKRFFENPKSKLFFVKGDINTWINKTRKFNSWGGKRTLLF
ncbi:probable serine/threonine-protein kinase clkA isoform X2 [Parasteatoda tepidariorum]